MAIILLQGRSLDTIRCLSAMHKSGRMIIQSRPHVSLLRSQETTVGRKRCIQKQDSIHFSADLQPGERTGILTELSFVNQLVKDVERQNEPKPVDDEDAPPAPIKPIVNHSYFNGPNRPSMTTYPLKTPEAFLSVIEKKENPLAYAKKLNEIRKDLQIETPVNLAVLFNIVEQTDLAELNALHQIAKAMDEMGLMMILPVNHISHLLLNNFLWLVKTGATSWEGLAETLGKLSDKMPAPEYFHQSAKDFHKLNSDESRRENFAELVYMVTRFYLENRNTVTAAPGSVAEVIPGTGFQAYSFNDFLLKMIDTANSLKTFPGNVFKPEVKARIMWHLLGNAPDPAGALSAAKAFSATMTDPARFHEMKQLDLDIYTYFRNPQTVPVVMEYTNRFADAGYPREMLTNFFTHPNHGFKFVSPETIQQLMAGTELFLSTHRYRKAINTVFESYWDKSVKVCHKEMPRIMAACLSVEDTIPEKFDSFAKRGIVRDILRKAETPDEAVKNLEHLALIFRETASSEPVQAMLFESLKFTNNLKLAEELKNLSLYIIREVPGMSSTSLSVLMDFMKNYTAAGALGQMKETLEALKTFLENPETRPKNLENFPWTVRYGMDFMKHKLLSPKEFPAFWTIMCDADPDWHINFRTLLIQMMEHGEKNQEVATDTLSKLRVMADICKTLKAKEIEPWDYSWLCYMEKQLEKAKPETWIRHFQAIPAVMEKIPQACRSAFNEYSPGFFSKFKDSAWQACLNGTYRGDITSLLMMYLENKSLLSTIPDFEAFLIRALPSATTLSGISRLIETLKTLHSVNNTPEKKLGALMSFLDSTDFGSDTQSQREALAVFTRKFLEDNQGSFLDYCRLFEFLVSIMAHSSIRHISDKNMKRLLDKALVEESKIPMSKFMPEIIQCLEFLQKVDKFGSPYINIILEGILELPNRWAETIPVLEYILLNKGYVPTLYDNEDQSRKPQIIENNIKAITAFAHPTRLLNHVMMNQDDIHLPTLNQLYQFIEYGTAQDSKRMGIERLPELMALLDLYGQKVNAQFPKNSKQRALAMGIATGGITRLFDYIYSPAIMTVHGVTVKNWARIGVLGLSFTKWQYDSMRLWKQGGPAEKPSLLAQSGHFTPVPPRDNDNTYYGGFQYHDPQSELTIELRRAYISISKPGLGSLIIRNSSPDFGRPLMESPAYYRPTKTYPVMVFPPEPAFNPDTDLPDKNANAWHYQNVFHKDLNRSDSQMDNHLKIQALLDAFDETMEPYVSWKCGFKDGKPPQGFKAMVKTALLSSLHDGQMSPFGKKKNIRLAWVNRFGLPFPVSTFDLSRPEHQREVAFYLDVLEKRATVKNLEEYEERIPNLLAFIKNGLANNLELVLTEASAYA